MRRLAVTALLPAVLLVGCSSGPPADHRAEYDPAWVAEAVDGCVSTGESREFCECALDVMTQWLSPAEYDLIDPNVTQASQLPKKVRDAAEDAEDTCRSEGL